MQISPPPSLPQLSSHCWIKANSKCITRRLASTISQLRSGSGTHVMEGSACWRKEELCSWQGGVQAFSMFLCVRWASFSLLANHLTFSLDLTGHRRQSSTLKLQSLANDFLDLLLVLRCHWHQLKYLVNASDWRSNSIGRGRWED